MQHHITLCAFRGVSIDEFDLAGGWILCFSALVRSGIVMQRSKSYQRWLIGYRSIWYQLVHCTGSGIGPSLYVVIESDLHPKSRDNKLMLTIPISWSLRILIVL